MTKWKSIAATGVMVALWLISSAAYALSCMSPFLMEEQAKAVYLIRITHVDGKPTEHSANAYVWNGNMQVLKVYRGDVQAVSTRTQLIVRSSCNDAWGPPCEFVSTPVAQAGELWLVFDWGEGVEHPVIWRAKCQGPSRRIERGAQLEVFEQTNTPLWVRE